MRRKLESVIIRFIADGQFSLQLVVRELDGRFDQIRVILGGSASAPAMSRW